ncbi:MAG: hypothetical protein IH623_04570 [Verrucomicrobia bacterium]|nr:hypothetical protein [Verrucomicrobiota bacterium]
MKTLNYSTRRQQGSVLAASLVIAFIIGATLASYMVMTQSQNTSVVRSQIWNSAIALSEAGVEDALAMINKYSGNFDSLPTWTNSASLSADNWTAIGGNVYYVRRYIGSNYYDAYITNANNAPTIYAAGRVHWNNAYASAPVGFLATVNGTVQPTSTTVSRQLEVRTKLDPLFNVAMAAERSIDLNGNNITTDSFDSADPNHSDNGLYPSNLSKTKAGGDVVSNDVVKDTLDIGNAKIKGIVKTGPKGTIAIGPNGSVGDRAWVESGKKGIKPGHSADDMNVLFPDVELPAGATTWVSPPLHTQNQLIGGLMYNYAFLTDGNYRVSSLGGNIYVGPNANVRLYVTGSASFSGGNRIDLAAGSLGGSTLRLYMGGSFSTTGNGAINNYNQNAAALTLFGLPSCTSIKFAGNAAYTGVVYAPQAHFHLGGGGNNEYDFVGSSVTKSVQMNGKFQFHYDENLRRVGLGRGYIPTKWAEVR